ncbi:MAG: FlgD immunoglobulin-like domain containing protein [Candidatus Krumholzibacteriia bacterium]
MSLLPTPWYEPPHHDPALTARAAVLGDILWHLGEGIIVIPGVEDTPAVTTATCYPNPFNPSATIELNLARAGGVTVAIYDVRGALVRELLRAELDAGPHRVVWDGANAQGRQVASGVYVYEVKAPGTTLVQKLTLVR